MQQIAFITQVQWVWHTSSTCGMAGKCFNKHNT